MKAISPKSPTIFSLGLAVSIVLMSLPLWGVAPVEAARKYYPPGFRPADVAEGASSPAEASQGEKTNPQAPQTTIIKTVPVKVLVHPKPRDPLLVMLDEYRYTDALRLIESRLKEKPADPDLRLTYATILTRVKEVDKAAAVYKALTAKSYAKSIREKAFVGLGDLAYQSESLDPKASLDAAETAYTQALHLNPRSVSALIGLSQVSLGQDEIIQAQSWLQKAVAISPSSLEVSLGKSKLLLRQGKPKDAIVILNRVRQTAPRNAGSALLLGRAYFDDGRMDDAIITLKRVLEQDPDNPAALKLMGLAYNEKQKPNDAEMTLKKAIAFNPNDAQAVAQLLALYDQRGQVSQALDLLRTQVQAQPKLVTYKVQLLDRLNQTQQWDEAFRLGMAWLEPLVSASEQSKEEKVEIDSLLAGVTQAMFQVQKPMLDRQLFYSASAVTALRNYLQFRHQESPSDLKLALYLLRVDPLTPIQLTDSDLGKTNQMESLSEAVQLAFLLGRQNLRTQLLTQFLSKAPLEESSSLRLVRDLMGLGDFDGAQMITQVLLQQKPDLSDAVRLSKDIQDAQTLAQEQIRGFQVMPGRMPPSQWRHNAEEALRVSGGNGRLHAALADFLLERKEYSLALTQQQLAAQYAPSESERARWLKKLEKTRQRINKRR